MTLSRIFAILSLLYGVLMTVATYAGSLPMFQFLHSDKAMGISFMITLLFISPFLSTYQRLGLVYVDKFIDPFSVSGDRNDRLMKECRMYPAAWYLPMIFLLISWIAFLVIGDSIQPNYALLASMSFISGLWFAFVYPTAKKMFV